MSADKTAWGEILMNIGLTGANDVMATDLESIGILKEDSLSLATEEGKKYELWGSGHELIDELQGEPTLTVSGIIIQVPEDIRKKLWEVSEQGSGDAKKMQVKSLVTKEKYSVQFASKVVGSETFEAPKCSVSMKPVFSETEGWTAEFSFKIIKSKITGVLFQFGTVASSAV